MVPDKLLWDRSKAPTFLIPDNSSGMILDRLFKPRSNTRRYLNCPSSCQMGPVKALWLAEIQSRGKIGESVILGSDTLMPLGDEWEFSWRGIFSYSVNREALQLCQSLGNFSGE